MLKAAIVGCGKIADQHVQAIERAGNARVVGVCDRELLMARQLAERFGIEKVFDDCTEMLEDVCPDVVHITTPPQSHFSLGTMCIEAGCHVYLEKPFTVTAEEAADLVARASGAGLILTAGHNCQFTPEMCEMRRLVKSGYLGGRAVHLESHWSYDLGDTSYVAPLLANRMHWVRQLPGQLFHNIISHGICRLAEFIDDADVDVTATARQSAKLCALNGQEVLDELRVMIWDARGTSAYFCFSTQVKPALNRLRVCGPANTIEVDVSSGTVTCGDGGSYKSYLTYVVPPWKRGIQQLGAAVGNLASVLAMERLNDAGMGQLVREFYRCIELRGAPPIPYREIVLTARIMDSIFSQVMPTPNSASRRSAECVL